MLRSVCIRFVAALASATICALIYLIILRASVYLDGIYQWEEIYESGSVFLISAVLGIVALLIYNSVILFKYSLKFKYKFNILEYVSVLTIFVIWDSIESQRYYEGTMGMQGGGYSLFYAFYAMFVLTVNDLIIWLMGLVMQKSRK